MTLDEFLGQDYLLQIQSSWGDWKMMNCGKRARCKEYRSSSDIDVEFEDGEIVTHKSKQAFVHGNIAHPSFYETCLGLRLQMHNKKYATCTAYRGAFDIDVTFDDGAVVEHVSKRNFVMGYIRHPDTIINYVGQRVVTLSGDSGVCIAHRSWQDVDVRLDNGDMLHGQLHRAFKGWVGKGNKNNKSVVGKVLKMACGLEAMCIEDRGSLDIDVEFEDGVKVRHIERKGFLAGHVRHPDRPRWTYKASEMIGKRMQMNCGYWCTVIEYFGAFDMTVVFDVGNCVVKHVYKSAFMDGRVRHPKLGGLTYASDSVAQRLLYYYICKFYNNVGYCVHPDSLKLNGGNGFELDIYIPELKIAIEFDGDIGKHIGYNDQNMRKNKAIEASQDVSKIFVVVDKGKDIAVFRTPKYRNIFLDYTCSRDRLPAVFNAAKIILEALGNDTSSLEFNYDIIRELNEKGVSLCQSLSVM